MQSIRPRRRIHETGSAGLSPMVSPPPGASAEQFYMQKQIQAQTPMVVVLDDGERIEGVIEWYDRNAIKMGGKGRCLIYKSAIKYLYKKGDTGAEGV